MKTLLRIFFTLTLSLSIIGLAACKKNDSGKKKIVCQTYPIYDWVMEITKGTDEFEISLLLDDGIDLHNYQATAKDLISISAADLFIYIGGESDEWVEDLADPSNKNQKSLSLLELLGDMAKIEEEIEGAEEEEEEEEEEEYDEHIWLSLRNAALLVRKIADSIKEADEDNAETYEKNASAYIASLNVLDQRFVTAFGSIEDKVMIVADRFPFRYLADDYEIEYSAAFSGCSAETEASFKTIRFLADRVNEVEPKAIYVLEASTNKIANAIIEASEKTGIEIKVIDSMQSISLSSIKEGYNFISVMEANLNTILQSLE